MKPARGASAALRWNNQDLQVALGGVYGRQSRNANTANAISYPDEPGLRKPDSLHFFRIVKEQPNKTYFEAECEFHLEVGSWWSQPGSNR